MLAELGQLVQEQHAPVREPDLPRSRLADATHQPRVRDGTEDRASSLFAPLLGDGIQREFYAACDADRDRIRQAGGVDDQIGAWQCS